MKPFDTRPTLLIIIGLMLALTSCRHRPLCFDHTHMSDVRVEFIWDESEIPSSMVVWFFPVLQGDEDEREPYRYELPGKDGGMVRLDVGPYICVAFNGETERNRDYGNTFGTLHITTGNDVIFHSDERQNNENMPYAPGTEGHSIRLSADRLWSDCVEQFTVLATKAHDAPLHQVVTFTPVERTTNIFVTVKNVKKLVPGAGMRAVITSQSEKYLPGAGIPDGVPVSVPFNLKADGQTDNPTMLTGNLIVFGHCHDTDRQHYVSLYNTTTRTAYHFDVTDQMHTAPDPRNIYITIDGSGLEPEEGGLGADVGEWSEGGDIDVGM